MHEQLVGVHPRVRNRLAQGAEIIAIPGTGLKNGLAYVEYVASTFDNGCPHSMPDALANLRETGIEFRWQFNLKKAEAVFGIAAKTEALEAPVKKLGVRRLLDTALNGQGSPELDDVMLLMVRPKGQVDGKDVLAGAISWDLVRRARWAVLNQNTRQVSFGRGNEQSKVA